MCSEVNSERRKLAHIAKQLSEQFKRENVTYDQSRYIFKMARQAVGLQASRKGLMVPKSLSESQVEKLFTVIENPTDLLLFRLIHSCALRVSGLCDLKRDNVNLDDFTITIRFNKTSGGVIPFPQSLKPLLRMHLQVTAGDTYLFQSSHRKPYSTRALQLKFKNYARLAGLPPDVAVHSLRHSCLSHLAAKGLTSSQLQGVSLHRSKSSLDSYVRLSAVEVRDAYNQVMK